MSAQTSQGGSSRKRRRQAVVCTECRRRKIACDRSIPCTQCIQSNSACTYYNSYSTSGGISGDQDGGIKPPYIGSTSTAAQTMYAFGPRPSLPVSTAANYFNAFPSTADASTDPLTAAISVDTGGTSWFDPTNLSALTLPLNMLIDTNNIPFTDASVGGLLEPDGVKPVADSAAVDATRPTSSSSQELAKVVFQKSRLYGPSHWMTLCRKKYEQQGLFHDISCAVFHGEGHPVLRKCKRLARGLKAKNSPDPQLLSQPLREFIPPKEVSDRLVQLYLRTFESVFRVLHVPTFKHDYVQYWSNPQAASECFELQLLLVMAIGTCFYQDPWSSDGADGSTLHEQSTQWIHAAHIRLAAPFRKKHLDLCGVQTQCLLILALLTNTNALGGDLFWITTASLVQSAMAIGLHFGPSQLPVSPFEAEIRRRLWATVLELAVQAGLDSGMHLVISSETLDSCELPSNLDDSQLSESIKTLPASQPTTTLTQNSTQCALMRSLPIRLKIAETLSRFRSEFPYDAAQRMGAELTTNLRETSDLIDSFAPTTPSAFQIQLQDLLARRFLLILHAQFAYKAASDVTYYFSRTVCLECSLLLLSPSRNTTTTTSSTSTNEPRGRDTSATTTTTTTPSHDVYNNLRVYGDGLFKSVFLAAAITVCAEVLLQQREDSAPAAASLSRRELLQAIEDAAALTRRRILRGETSVKAHVFLACVLAKTGTHRRRTSQLGGGGKMLQNPTDAAVEEAAKRALDACCAVLEVRMGRATPVAAAAPRIPELGGAGAGGGSSHHHGPSRQGIEVPESPPPPPRDGGKDDACGGGLGRRSERVGDTSSLEDSSDAWLSQLASYSEGWID
ncbi:hypothetical protein F5B20DRAFT_592600 [Whalleya microplaca]|nr:hypothetical protein F5B20DRAFT_592600 [Whalleya microplaca]